MRWIGLACVCAFVVVLTAFGLKAGPEGPVSIAPFPPSSGPVTAEPRTRTVLEPIRADEPEGTAPTEVTRSQEITQEAAPRPAPAPRDFRRRNRYPGPIPSPADWKPPEGPVRIALQPGAARAAAPTTARPRIFDLFMGTANLRLSAGAWPRAAASLYAWRTP